MNDYVSEIEAVEHAINLAVLECKLAYNYSPGSYTYGALAALHIASERFEKIRTVVGHLS